MDMNPSAHITPAQWDLAAAHLETLQTLPEEEKQVYLADMKEQSPEIYHWVVKLSAADERYGTALESTRKALSGIQVMTERDDLIGRVVGRYKLVEKLGEGGMGEVYLGHRSDDFEQVVAVKVFRYALINDQLARRFQKEQHILARLRHPSVASFIDAGISAAHIPYLAMEYVQGTDIISHCAAQKSSLETRLQWIIQICDALQYLHNNLIIHRDIKPGNLLVTSDERVKILDFGIAKVLEDAETNEKGQETQIFQLVLTPNYASPEQLYGKPVSVLSDVYAVGVLLYELLTGKLPYQIKEISLTELDKIFSVRPPSLKKSFDAALPAGRWPDHDLETIVFKALSKEPAERYVSVAALGDDLQRWIRKEPIAAKPPTWTYKLSRFVARNRIAVGLTTIILFLVMAGLGLTVWQSYQIRQESQKTSAVLHFMEDALVGYDPFSDNPIHQDSAAVRVLIRNSLRSLQNIPTSNHEVRARILNLLTSIASSRNLMTLADSLNMRAFGEMPNPAAFPETAAESYYQKGKLDYLRQRFDRALQQVDRGLALVTRSSPESEKRYLGLLNMKTDVYMDQGKYAAADQILSSLNPWVRERYGAQSLEYVRQLAQQAILLYYQRKFNEAASNLEQTIPVFKQHRGENHPYLGTLYNNLSLMFLNMGKNAEAARALEKSNQIRTKVFGAHAPDVFSGEVNLATLYYNQGLYDQAEAGYRKVIKEAAGQENASDIVQAATLNLGDVLRQKQQLDDALECLTPLLKTFEQLLPAEHKDLLEVHYQLGEIYREKKAYDRASVHFQAMIQATQNMKPVSPRYAKALLKMAWMNLMQGKRADGEAWIRKFESVSGAFEESSFTILEYHMVKGYWLMKTGDHAKGRSQMQAAIAAFAQREMPDQTTLRIAKEAMMSR